LSAWLYERNLVPQKYHILIAVRHDRIVRTIAADLGIGVQELRKYMIEHLDMIHLENLPARYEAAVAAGADAADPVAEALGHRLLTVAIPLIPGRVMEQIISVTKERIAAGTPVADAVAAGKAMLGKVIAQ
jgi:hypothetical protein